MLIKNVYICDILIGNITNETITTNFSRGFSMRKY